MVFNYSAYMRLIYMVPVLRYGVERLEVKLQLTVVVVCHLCLAVLVAELCEQSLEVVLTWDLDGPCEHEQDASTILRLERHVCVYLHFLTWEK